MSASFVSIFCATQTLTMLNSCSLVKFEGEKQACAYYEKLALASGGSSPEATELKF